MARPDNQLSLDMPIVRTVTICNDLGLHARPSARVVDRANQFDAEVTVTKDGQTVSARSIMGLLMLAAAKGETVELSATGRQAAAALAAIADMFENGFGEIEQDE